MPRAKIMDKSKQQATGLDLLLVNCAWLMKVENLNIKYYFEVTIWFLTPFFIMVKVTIYEGTKNFL